MTHRCFLFKQSGLPFCYLFHVLALPMESLSRLAQALCCPS